MTHQDMFKATDIENFANHLGLDGLDADLFYESYYHHNSDEEGEYDIESVFSPCYDSYQ